MTIVVVFFGQRPLLFKQEDLKRINLLSGLKVIVDQFT